MTTSCDEPVLVCASTFRDVIFTFRAPNTSRIGAAARANAPAAVEPTTATGTVSCLKYPGLNNVGGAPWPSGVLTTIRAAAPLATALFCLSTTEQRASSTTAIAPLGTVVG